MKKKIKLFFVRHGETYFNKYGKMQGWSDTPLTENGIASAKKTGEKLKDVLFEKIICSDLGRTIATANVILSESNCNKEKTALQNSAFRESFFGYFEGSDSKSTYTELAKQLGVEQKNFFDLGLEKISAAFKEFDPYHEAENYEECLKRMKQGLCNLVDSTEQETCNYLVVTHGNVIRMLVHDIDSKIPVTVEIQNASVTVIAYEDARFYVESFNQI